MSSRSVSVSALMGLASAVAACGGGGSQAELTCALLADPTNCWAAASSAAEACLAMRATPGVLSADRTACTWSDGSQVTFDTALPTSTLALDHLTFSVTAPGCAWSFTDTFHNHMELTVGDKTEISELEPDRTFDLTCDDGTTYATSFDTIVACAAPARAPTDGFDVEPTSFQFTLAAVGVPTPLFTCMQ